MLYRLSLAWALLAAAVAQAQPQSFDIRRESMYLPAPQESGRFGHSLALVQIYLPKDWLERSISGPMVEYKVNYALPKGLELNGSFRTLVVANDLRAGFAWKYSFSPSWHMGVGYQLAFDFGFLRTYGYDNTVRILQHHPVLRLGYNKKDIAFTVQGKLDYISSARVSLGAYETDNLIRYLFNGFSCGAFIEQRLTRHHSVSFGFIANFDKFIILGWPAFNTIHYKYFIPELNIGFKL